MTIPSTRQINHRFLKFAEVPDVKIPLGFLFWLDVLVHFPPQVNFQDLSSKTSGNMKHLLSFTACIVLRCYGLCLCWLAGTGGCSSSLKHVLFLVYSSLAFCCLELLLRRFFDLIFRKFLLSPSTILVSIHIFQHITSIFEISAAATHLYTFLPWALKCGRSSLQQNSLAFNDNFILSHIIMYLWLWIITSDCNSIKICRW